MLQLFSDGWNISKVKYFKGLASEISLIAPFGKLSSNKRAIYYSTSKKASWKGALVPVPALLQGVVALSQLAITLQYRIDVKLSKQILALPQERAHQRILIYEFQFGYHRLWIVDLKLTHSRISRASPVSDSKDRDCWVKTHLELGFGPDF